MRAEYGQYARDLKTRADLDLFRIVVVNISIFWLLPGEYQSHRKIRKTGYDDAENGLDMRQRQLSISRED